MSSSAEFDKLLESVEALGRYEFKNADERFRAMQATRAVSDKLQRPYEKFVEMWGAVSAALHCLPMWDVDRSVPLRRDT